MCKNKLTEISPQVKTKPIKAKNAFITTATKTINKCYKSYRKRKKDRKMPKSTLTWNSEFLLAFFIIPPPPTFKIKPMLFCSFKNKIADMLTNMLFTGCNVLNTYRRQSCRPNYLIFWLYIFFSFLKQKTNHFILWLQ